jgi:hypothetical protein
VLKFQKLAVGIIPINRATLNMNIQNTIIIVENANIDR